MLNCHLYMALLLVLFATTGLQSAFAQSFSKPVVMFDNTTAEVVPPKIPAIEARARQLHLERGFTEEVYPMRDKRGMTRVAFMQAGGALQTNCTPYADMYFDAKGQWISTEEYFTVAADTAAARGVGRIVRQVVSSIEAKNYRVGICEENGNPSLWKISTPNSTWYECEIFKKATENIALAITIQAPPYRAPNQSIFGTAYFDSKGNLIRIQAKSKVKIANAALNNAANKR
jgi:hypothetical protein